MYLYLCYFIIYAFLGWCLEVSYKAVTAGCFVNRGFLNGPVCPIYGFGMIIVIFALTPIAGNPGFLFIGSVLLTSTLEWLTGFVLEKAFHAKWWDYSQVPFNISGYICLKFSIAWGLACMFILNIVQPFIAKLVDIVPVFAGKIVIFLVLAGMLSDTILTINTVMKLNKQLNRLEEVGAAMRKVSDELGENIFEGVTDIKERSEKVKAVMEEKKLEMDNIKTAIASSIAEAKENMETRGTEMAETIEKKLMEMEKLKLSYDDIAKEKHLGQRRLLSAFPDIKHTHNRESLEHIKHHLKLK